MAPFLSVILPVYNEAESLSVLLPELCAVLDTKIKRECEIIVVDDASTDNSVDIAEYVMQSKSGKFCSSLIRISVIRQETNQGQAAAIFAGIEQAAGELIVTMDADLEHDPADIPVLLEEMRGSDMICGIREKRSDGFFRKACSVVANTFRNCITGDFIADSGCTFRIMKAKCVPSFAMLKGRLDGCEFFFFPLFARKAGFIISQCKINHRIRKFGKSKYRLVNGRLVRGIRACFKVRGILEK